MFRIWVFRWFPAVFLMAAIFIFSAYPSTELPDLGSWDYFVKKGGHMIGYGLLALAYWHGLNPARGNKWFAWGLAICYAITDEIHQSFVPGRYPSPFDVLFFDNLGAILGLVFVEAVGKLRRSLQD